MEDSFAEFYADVRQIANAIKANKLVVFVGAGVSMNSGIPSWENLIKTMQSELPENPNEKDYLKIAQLYKLSRKPKEYLERIREILKYERASYNPIHKAIFKLKPCHVVTTNYDDLIEQYASAHNLLYYPIVKDDDLPFATFENFIIKMHGDLSVGNIVLSEEEYLNYNINFPLTENYVKSLFSTKLILFIGFSFNDYNLKIITNKVKNILGSNFQPMYLLSLEKPDFLQLKYYEDRGVKIVSYNEVVHKTEKINISGIDNLSKGLGKNLFRFIDFIASFDTLDYEIRNKPILDKLLALNDFYFSELRFIGRKDLLKLIPDNSTNYGIDNPFTITITNKEVQELRSTLKTSIKAKRIFLKIDGFNYKKLLSTARENLIFYLKFPNGLPFPNEFENSYIGRYPVNAKDSIDSFFELDYTAVKKRIEYLENQESGEVSMNNLELPYLLYKLGDDYEAYLRYTVIANKFWSQKKYVLFFLCMFNIKNLSVRIKYKMKADNSKDVLKEIDGIDLYNLLSKLPINNPTIEKILRKVTSYSFVLERTNEAPELKDKILESKRLNEGSGFSLNNNDIELYETIGWLWSFCNNNYIISEHLSENKRAYSNAAEAFLINHSVKPQPNNRFSGAPSIPSPLNKFHTLLISISIESKALGRILNNFKLDAILFDKGAKEYLDTTFTNGMIYISSSDSIKENNHYQIYNQLENVLILLGRSQLSKEQARSYYNLLIDTKNLRFRSLSDGLSSFTFKTLDLIDDIVILESLIEKIFRGGLIPSYRQYSNVLTNLFRRILEIDKEYKIKSEIVLNELFSNYVLNDTYETEFLLILKEVLPTNKDEQLKQNILERLESKFEFALLNMAVAYGLDLGEGWNKRFIQECVKYFKTRTYKSSSHDDWYLNTLYRFWIKNRNTTNNKLVNELSKNQPLLSFLIDPTNFDYSNEQFAIYWLTYIDEKELKRIIRTKKLKSYLKNNIELVQKEKWLVKMLL